VPLERGDRVNQLFKWLLMRHARSIRSASRREVDGPVGVVMDNQSAAGLPTAAELGLVPDSMLCTVRRNGGETVLDRDLIGSCSLTDGLNRLPA